MRGRMPEGFQVDERQMERLVSAVSGRIVRRKAHIRLAKRSGAAILAFALLGGAAYWTRLERSASMADPPPIVRSAPSSVLAPTPGGDSSLAAALDAAADRPVAVTPATPPLVTLSKLRGEALDGSKRGSQRNHSVDPLQIPRRMTHSPAPGLPVTLAKVDHSVAIRWQGPKDEKYAIYRCQTPTFETCSMADTVQGTSWVEPGLDGPGTSGTIIYYKVVLRSGV